MLSIANLPQLTALQHLRARLLINFMRGSQLCLPRVGLGLVQAAGPQGAG